jgi:hypothetical protein
MTGIGSANLPHLGRDMTRLARRVGFAAMLFSGLYLLSDVIESLQNGFSDPQLALTLVGEAAVPFFVVGLYVVQRPKIGRLGLGCAIAYAYSYVFFTATVIYAMAYSTKNYSALTADLGALMTAHGAIMVTAGIGFGVAVVRAGVLPAWTGVVLGVGVVAVALTQTAPEGIQLAAAGIRAAGFAGMGLALLLAARAENS